MHSIDALNEKDNQTHYQSQHDCKKWEKYQHLKVIHLLAEIAWDASLSYFDQNKNNAWCMKFIFWSFIVHLELPRIYRLGPTPFTQCIILEPKVGAELNTYYEDESFACLCILNFGKTPCRYKFNGINDDIESEELFEFEYDEICIGPFKKMKSQ